MRGDKNIASSGNCKNKCSTEVHDVPNYFKKVPSKMDASHVGWMNGGLCLTMPSSHT